MHSNDGHGIQPHITFHFQLFALFLRISSVCGRVSLYLSQSLWNSIKVVTYFIESVSALSHDWNLDNFIYSGIAIQTLMLAIYTYWSYIWVGVGCRFI